MFSFLERDQPGQAAVFFPGSAPPPADAFLRLRDLGYQLTERRSDTALWALDLQLPTIGSADLWCERDGPPLADFIRYANNLSDGERAEAAGSASSVRLQVPAKRRQVLRDRKTLLRIARDLLGADGVMVLDLASELPWSRAALVDELVHDADLDIESLYCLHNVYGGTSDANAGAVADPTARPASSDWVHSHGLAELGGFDLDLVAPHPEFVEQMADVFRGLAMMVLEGTIAADQDRFTFGHPGGEGRLVRAADFMQQADPAMVALREGQDHDDRRSVVCEPRERKRFGFGRGDRPEPLHLARRPLPQQFVAYFPTSMTTLMAQRAAATVDVLRALMAEFAEFEPVPVVKLGYPTTDGGKEHLWFTVHAIGGTTVDATLQNRPFGVDLVAGERAEHPLELLTDWILMTPAGPIHPRSMAAARRLREHAGEIRAQRSRTPQS